MSTAIAHYGCARPQSARFSSQLVADGRNVAFGRVIAGMDVIRTIGASFAGELFAVVL